MVAWVPQFDDRVDLDVAVPFLGRVSNLKGLDLSYSEASDNELFHLRRLKLISLRLTETKCSDEGMKHLASMTGLRTLHLKRTELTDAGLACLSRMTALEDLDLAFTDCTDQGIQLLSRNPNLKVLNLRHTRITDDGLRTLAELAHLNSLDLRGTDCTDSGMKHLSKLTQLKYLYLPYTVSRRAKYDIEAALPRCHVAFKRLPQSQFPSWWGVITSN